jgi:agmatine deiminase
MITDIQTNFLFLADTIVEKHPMFYRQFETVLKECGISFGVLPGTRDIWARDYMPIQVTADKFVQFVYNPDYLKDEYGQKIISDTDSICKKIGIAPVKSSIKVDGGNVVRSSNKVIMCDKVFLENPQISEKQLIKELQEQLETDQLIFIPTDPSDKIGHADGMVRFLDDRTVLINNFSKEKIHFQLNFRMALHNAGLDWVEIPYNPYDNKDMIEANGIYINYLQMQDVIVLPVFGMKEDELAISVLESLFPNDKLGIINCNDIAKQGGVLNCATWNIMHLNIY